MQHSRFTVLSTKPKITLSKKLIFGAVSAATVGIVASAGIAAAHPGSGSSSNGASGVVANCKAHYQLLGFKNVGDCVSHMNGHGHGYGG